MTVHVGVVGGGLAGIAAALRCADAGCTVTLLEADPRLGGLARSFRRGELTVDTGQHVFLRCCTAYRGLLARLGVADLVTLQPRLDIPIRAPGRRPGRIRRSRLPAPLHLLASLGGYRALRPLERARLVPAALALRALDPADPAVDAQSFGGWLTRHGQGPRAIAGLWDLFGLAALNVPAADASLALAATVFQDGLLTRADAGDLGWARVPLGRLHDDAARRGLTAAGVTVRTATRVHTLLPAGGAWCIRAGNRGRNTEIAVDRVVCAVPPRAAEGLLPGGALDRPPGWAAALGRSPIVNVHVVYDRPVLDVPFAAGLDTPAQWVFDRSGPAGLRVPGAQYLAVSLSAAEAGIGQPTAALRSTMLPALAALLPAARVARVLDFFVTREPAATFRATPGTAALRPPATTRLPGLLLAGAWTATGWPATMEGAVRSGNAAAAALLADAAPDVRPDVRPDVSSALEPAHLCATAPSGKPGRGRPKLCEESA